MLTGRFAEKAPISPRIEHAINSNTNFICSCTYRKPPVVPLAKGDGDSRGSNHVHLQIYLV